MLATRLRAAYPAVGAVVILTHGFQGSSMHTIALARSILLFGLVGSFLHPAQADAKSADRQLPVDVQSIKFDGYLRPNSKTVIDGAVQIKQGSLKGSGTHGELYADASGHIVRIVLMGKQAHVEQVTDDGLLDQADADRIDYNIGTSIAVLTGRAKVSKQSSGMSTGDEITYNLDTSEMHANGTADRLVHVQLVPKAHVINDSPSVAGSIALPPGQ